MDEEPWGFILGIFIGGLLVALVLLTNTVWYGTVDSGEEFIKSNASYKCMKTNELKGKVE